MLIGSKLGSCECLAGNKIGSDIGIRVDAHGSNSDSRAVVRAVERACYTGCPGSDSARTDGLVGVFSPDEAYMSSVHCQCLCGELRSNDLCRRGLAYSGPSEAVIEAVVCYGVFAPTTIADNLAGFLVDDLDPSESSDSNSVFHCVIL